MVLVADSAENSSQRLASPGPRLSSLLATGLETSPHRAQTDVRTSRSPPAPRHRDGGERPRVPPARDAMGPAPRRAPLLSAVHASRHTAPQHATIFAFRSAQKTIFGTKGAPAGDLARGRRGRGVARGSSDPPARSEMYGCADSALLLPEYRYRCLVFATRQTRAHNARRPDDPTTSAIQARTQDLVAHFNTACSIHQRTCGALQNTPIIGFAATLGPEH